MVLTTARRPAILVETGFATNPTDGAFLASSLGEHKIASAVAEGITKYLQEFERKRAASAPAGGRGDRKSTRLNSSHLVISYAVFCLKKKKTPMVSSPSRTFASPATINAAE